MGMFRDEIEYIIVGFFFGVIFFGALSFTYNEEEKMEEAPVKLQSIKVKLLDENNIIHSREEVINNGEVLIKLSGKE